MKLTVALAATTMMGLAGPALAADLYGHEGRHGWGHRHHHHARQHRHHHHGRFVADEPVTVVEYREPYLPRGVLYNAPPLPLAYGYGHRGRYRDVIRAKY